jgi:hypothetical protein
MTTSFQRSSFGKAPTTSMTGAPPSTGTTSIQAGEDFTTSMRAGSVIGSVDALGRVRKGVDKEGIVGIDNGALRIEPLIEPGWGRAGLSYGPFERRNGRAFAVYLVNCHNTSQSENLRETFRDRFDRWLRGPELYSRGRRLWQWLLSKRKWRMLRQWRWWRRIAVSARPVPRIDENLAIGWFASEVPADPLAEGNALVMHATGAENGELWARVGQAMLPTVRSVQNLQIHYVVVLRERGAAYYASSVEGANGLGTYPDMRLLAIDAFNNEPSVYAGVFQAALGQIGFRLDTRIYGTRVLDIPEWGTWYGTAHAADRLAGSGELAGSPADAGGAWAVTNGRLERSSDGVFASESGSRAILPIATASGVIHVVVQSGEAPARAVSLIWRHADSLNFWELAADASGCDLVLHVAGHAVTIAHTDAACLEPNRPHAMQVADEGHRFSLFLNGTLLFGQRFVDARLAHASGVGIAIPTANNGVHLTNFEAHPMRCRLPDSLDQGKPWWRLGEQVRVSDDFEGPKGDLEGRRTLIGDQTWRRIIGSGHIDVTGDDSARFRGSPQDRVPGRLAYTVDWMHPEFADLEVEITPAGTGPGQGQHGLCGFILWQDPDNYVMLNIWRNEVYDGASISTFFQLDGFEDLYDAIWANVGNRVYWGRPHRLRIAFDGMHYMALVDDEPVLYRALTDVYPDAKRLQIRRVGLLSNWEWGTDTGSVLRRFRARV